METEHNDGRQQQECEEHQQWLLANPMSQAEYDRRKELWDSFFSKEVEKIRQFEFQDFVTAHEADNGHSTSSKAPF